MLLDQGTKDALQEAKETLEGLMTEEYPIDDPADTSQTEELPLGKHERTVRDPEIDNRVLVYSLLGMLKKSIGKTQQEKIEGMKLQDRAKEISHNIPGGAVMFERKKWLLIPKLTSRDMFRDEQDESDEELE
jgi:hypothetical protein